jgi:hypothetical protein
MAFVMSFTDDSCPHIYLTVGRDGPDRHVSGEVWMLFGEAIASERKYRFHE